jgi:hypothetical protein
MNSIQYSSFGPGSEGVSEGDFVSVRSDNNSVSYCNNFVLPVFNNEDELTNVTEISDLTQSLVEEKGEGEEELGEGEEEEEEDYEEEDYAFDPKKMLSLNQIKAGKKIISNFIHVTKLCRWSVLFAQMQSGKTLTFRFVGAEMLRLNLVQYVVIFSGNAETELKNQLTCPKKKSEFIFKYRKYLQKLDVYTEDDIYEITEQLRDDDRIRVVWGTELKKYSGPTANTLFIWEESHHAQNVSQCPDAFLRNAGISADGDEQILRGQGNFVLSVSATPFSEFSDNHHEDQSKRIVRMMPGAKYNSVERMKNTNHIVAYSVLADGLTQAFSMPTTEDAPKWAIVRASSVETEALVCRIATDSRYVIAHYNSDPKTPCIIDGQIQGNLDFLQSPPSQNTVVILKEMCRMGKELYKNHLLFCFETAKNSKSDTLLQGLLGRCCGYFENDAFNVFVYLPEKFVKSDELQRYIEFANGSDIICRNGRNLKKEKQYDPNATPIVQVLIAKQYITVDLNKCGIVELSTDIQCAFTNGNISDLNKDAAISEQIRNLVLNSPAGQFVRQNLSNDNKTYGAKGKDKKIIGVADKIRVARETLVPVLIASSKGRNKENGIQINLWVVKRSSEDGKLPAGMKEGDVYVDCRVVNETTAENIPKTTGKEVFAHKMENGQTVVSNGAFSIHLRPETAFSPEEMLDDLLYIVGISLSKTKNSVRSINSNQDNETKEYKGICVNNNVLLGLQKGGSIYNQIIRTYGKECALKITKASGKVPKVLADVGLVRLTAITW